MAKARKPKGSESKPEEKWSARTVRMPESVWEEIDRDADENRRSSNQHILWIVEQHLKAKRPG